MRRQLGIAIVSGLVISQILTLFTTPVVYVAMESLRLWIRALFGLPTPDTSRPDVPGGVSAFPRERRPGET